MPRDENVDDQFARSWLDWLRDVRGRAPGTLYDYAKVLHSFYAHLGPKPVAEATLTDLEAFLARPRGGKSKDGRAAAATRARESSILRTFFGYLLHRELIRRNPALLLSAPKVANQHPKPIPDAAWARLWRSDLELSDRVALGLGFYAGLRRREVCQLTPEQVLTTNHTLVGFVRKGGGDDILPYGDIVAVLDEKLPHLLARELLEPLERYVEKRQGHPNLIEWGETTARNGRRLHALPAGQPDPGIFNRRMRRICAAAGLDSWTPHQLRHSMVTNLLRSGVPIHIVSRLANHSNVAITMRYAKAGQSELREWFRSVNPNA